MRIKKSAIGIYLLLASATSNAGTVIQSGQEFTINLSGGLISATGGAATDIPCWQGGTFMQNGNVMSSLTVPFVSGSGIMYDISSGAPIQIGSYNSTCSYTLTPSSSAPSVINGVANGVALTDAVNLGQLNAVASGANNYANTVGANTLTSANNYANTVGANTLTSANNYANTVGTNTLTSANGYTNSQITGLGTKTNGSLSSVAASFGSGSTYNPVTGVFTQPTYTVKGTSYNNVGSALNALNAASSSSTNNLGTSTAQSLGSGATYDLTTGSISAPNYNIGGTGYNNVGSALTATDTKADNLGSSTAQSIGGNATYDPATGNISAPTIQSAGLTHNNTTDAIQALDKAAVQYDKNSDGSVNTDNVTMQGVNGTTIHNVAAGVMGTDAANVQQVMDAQNNAINTANAYTDKQVNNLDAKTQAQIATLGNQNQQQFKALNNAIKANSSVAAAMTGLVPNYMTKSKHQVQAAVGYGAGAVGVAAGTTYQLTNDVLLVGKLGVSTTGNTGFQNRVGGAVGVSFGL